MNWKKPCLFCLEYPDSSVTKTVTRNPKNVEIRPLLHYLTGVDPTSDGQSSGSSIPVMTQLPLLCLSCYDKVAQLHQLHQNLVEIQRLIQHLTLDMRKIVADCKIVGGRKRKSKLDTFHDDLRSTPGLPESRQEMIFGFIKGVHDLIIAEGSNGVIFPSKLKSKPESDDGDPPEEINQEKVVNSMEVDPHHDLDNLDSEDLIKVEHPTLNDQDYDLMDDSSDSSESEDFSADDDNDNDDDDDDCDSVDLDCEKPPEPVPTPPKCQRVPKKLLHCDYEGCTMTFITKNWLTVHKRTVHGETSETKFACRFCEKIFESNWTRNTHYKRAHPGRDEEIPRRRNFRSLPYTLTSKPDNTEAQQCLLCVHPRGTDIWVELSKMGDHMEAHLGKGRRGWSCPACSEFYPARSIILDHIRTNSECARSTSADFLKHICALCQPQENEFETEMDLFHHVFNLHEKDESLEMLHKCRSCESKYRTELGLDFHVNRHVTDRKWKKFIKIGSVPCPKEDEQTQCKLCNQAISGGQQELKIHIATEHKDKIKDFVKCKICSTEQFIDREEYLSHLQSHHNEKDVLKPCDLCESEVFDRVSQLRKHYFHIHQIGSQFMCDHCSGTFYTEESFKEHIRRHHTEPKGKFVCEFCLKSGDTKKAYLSTKRLFEKHLAKVHPVDRFKCERVHCTAQFRCKADFMEHEKNDHHSDPLICPDPFCTTEFLHAIYLKIHVEKVHREKLRECTVMKCSVCDKAFRNASSLKKHEMAHSDEKTFQCDQCPKSFKSGKYLKDHQLTHLPGGRPRPFVCELCSRAFFDNKLLEQHRRIHTGERPFSCQFCGMTFRQKCSLRTHELGHKTRTSKKISEAEGQGHLRKEKIKFSS